MSNESSNVLHVAHIFSITGTRAITNQRADCSEGYDCHVVFIDTCISIIFKNNSTARVKYSWNVIYRIWIVI